MTIALSPVGKLGSQFFFNTADREIGERIALGKFEPFLTKLVLDYLRPGMNIVDAGANIGYYSVLAAKLGCNVFAFEPNKHNYELLIKNIKYNKVEKQIKAYQIALGDKKKKTKLYLSKVNFGDHSIFATKDRQKEEVKMDRLDDLIKNIKIDFIKSDTQGAEEQIFKGACKLIQKYMPEILFESWDEKITLDNYHFYLVDEYLQFRSESRKFFGESVNIWATKKSLSFMEKYRDFWFKKLVKQVLNLPKT